MQLIRRSETWNPFRELEELSGRFQRLFGVTDASRNGQKETLALADWVPAVNISENEKEYRIRAEIPETRKEDVQVTLEDGVLTIQGERKQEKEEKTEKFHRRELMVGKFVRQFTMPEDADESKIEASFKEGMLSVTIGKSTTKSPASRQIAVH
jgi:HSP20 family protein